MRAVALISVGVATLVACGEPGTPTTPTNVQATLTATVPPPPPSAPPIGGSSPERYTLTLSIGSSCTVVPESDRTRTYRATIQKSDAQGSSDAQRSIVTLEDGQFLSGPICTAGSGRFNAVGCNQFFAGEDIDTALFFLVNNNDEAHGGHIVERLPSGGWWEVTGSAAGLRTTQSIDASGTASVWYCSSPLPYPFPCVAFTSCNSAELRLRFTPR
jgi:hypothetical protein